MLVRSEDVPAEQFAHARFFVSDEFRRCVFVIGLRRNADFDAVDAAGLKRKRGAPRSVERCDAIAEEFERYLRKRDGKAGGEDRPGGP